MSSVKFHFAKILDVEPSPISCMSLNHANKKLALFRGGSIGAIEIWDVNHQPFLEREILELETIDGKPSVESVVWANNRLFSCGLHGFVIEHDVRTGKLLHKSAATSGSVWCIGVNPAQTIIAAGTEDGFVNLFKIEERSLTHLRVLDRQDGRVLCLQWSPCGRYIGTGSIDSVRLWDVNKGHAVQRLITGRSKNKETIVWSILVLDDFTIVTGDSRGIVSFWDGRIGVLKFKMQTHKADVLTLRLSTDKSSIYAAGVDPVILNIAKIGNTDKWIKSHPRNIHVNDVMTLETYGNRLFSGGIDTDLAMSSFPPKIITRYPNIPKFTQISGSDNAAMILVKYAKSITIWKLPANSSPLTKVLQFESKGGENIFSASISQNGSLFAYSTSSGAVKVFQISNNNNIGETVKPTLQKLHFENSPEFSSHNENQLMHLKFVHNNSLLLLSSNGRFISFGKINPDTNSVCFVNSEELGVGDEDHDGKKASANLGIGLVTTSESNLCITLDTRVIVYSISKNDSSEVAVKPCCSLPTHSALPSSITLHPQKPLVLVTYVDNSVIVFNFKVGKILFQEIVRKKFDDLQPFQGACWSSDGTCAVIFQNDCMFLLELSNDNAVEPKRKRKSAVDSSGLENLQIQIKSCPTKYKYLAYVGAYNDGQEFVVVEVDPHSILEHLPPAFAKKRFGA